MADGEGRFGLEGKTCIVTGGGGGIGREIALGLAREKAFVVLLDLNIATADETRALVRQTGSECVSFKCDVSKKDEVEGVANALLEQFGSSADVLINNAAVNHLAALADTRLDDWNRVIAINLTSYFICAQVFGRAMLEKGAGAVVNVGSLVANYVSPGQSVYSVAKAGVTMLSKALAVEWAPQGVRSNTVLPGFVMTPMSKATYEVPGLLEARTKAIPARRIGQPSEIADAVLYLASPLSSYVNGTEIVVDGGFTPNLVHLVPRFVGRK